MRPSLGTLAQWPRVRRAGGRSAGLPCVRAVGVCVHVLKWLAGGFTPPHTTLSAACRLPDYLEKAGKNDGKFTFTVDGHTFNFLNRAGWSEPTHGVGGRGRARGPRAMRGAAKRGGWVTSKALNLSGPCRTCCLHHAAYLVVADEAYGRAIPAAFLDKMAVEWTAKHAEKAGDAKEGQFNGTFG